MVTKITHSIWVGLQTGRIHSVNEGGHIGCLMYAHDYFIMEKYVDDVKITHTLWIEKTDHERLNAHWIGFCNS